MAIYRRAYTFTGETDAFEDASDWFAALESNIYSTNTDEEKLQLFVSKLFCGSTAQTWHKQLPKQTRNSWEQTREEFLVKWCGKTAATALSTPDDAHLLETTAVNNIFADAAISSFTPSPSVRVSTPTVTINSFWETPKRVKRVKPKPPPQLPTYLSVPGQMGPASNHSVPVSPPTLSSNTYTVSTQHTLTTLLPPSISSPPSFTLTPASPVLTGVPSLDMSSLEGDLSVAGRQHIRDEALQEGLIIGRRLGVESTVQVLEEQYQSKLDNFIFDNRLETLRQLKRENEEAYQEGREAGILEERTRWEKSLIDISPSRSSSPPQHPSFATSFTSLPPLLTPSIPPLITCDASSQTDTHYFEVSIQTLICESPTALDATTCDQYSQTSCE